MPIALLIFLAVVVVYALGVLTGIGINTHARQLIDRAQADLQRDLYLQSLALDKRRNALVQGKDS